MCITDKNIRHFYFFKSRARTKSITTNCGNNIRNGEYDAGETYTTTVEFSEYKNSALYDISFENLKITYRITSMKFNGEHNEREYDGETVVIKDLS